MKTFLAFITILLLAGCSPSETIDTGGSNDRIPVEVLSVIDGDTIKIEYGGKETTVRYLLIAILGSANSLSEKERQTKTAD